MTGLARIGAASAGRLAAVRAALDSVARRDLPEAVTLLRAARQRVDATAANISFVGQVKAGKSSLINALAGTGGLLPTEVNPWTAVITNLHFGHPGQKPGSAVFRFFSTEEWARMLDGGSESRRLAEQFLPGFKSEILASQIQEMQDRAKARLGDMFHLLLGKEHRFAEVSPEVLERYVSAGYGGSQAGDPNAGKYSNITRSAEVFLDPGPFLVPATITDTPGINDPFLVRDEITTSSFRSADVFVVTLSAHQTLNPADIALLRLLAHHGGDRVLIFVNRIDELDDPASSVPILVRALKARLAREFGDSAHEVIAGSARWGARAATEADADVAAAAADCAAYARAIGVPADTPPRQMLLAASGLDRLAAALTDLIDRGKVAPGLTDALTQAVNEFGYLGSALSERLDREVAATAGGTSLASLARQETARIDARLAGLVELDRELARLSDAGRDHLRDTCARATETAMKAIRAAVERFVDEQLVAFRAAYSADGPARAWRFDTAIVQDRAQRQVMDSYEAGRAGLDGVLQAAAADLNAALVPAVRPLPVEGLLDGLPNFRIMPGLRARSNLVEVELTRERGWQFWRSRTLGEDEAVERITRVIHAELNPQLVELHKAIGRALAGRSAAALDRLHGLLARARDLIAHERADLRADAQMLSGEIDATASARLAALRDARMADLRAKIDALAEARNLLAAQLADPPPPEPAKAPPQRRVGG